MKLKVTCKSGYSSCDRPKAVEIDGIQHEVGEVLNEWREPHAKIFIVRLDNDLQLKLLFHENTGEWEALELFNSQ